MKKSILALALVLVVAMGATACSDKDDSASGSSDLNLVNDGKLTVCSDIPYAPFEYFDDGGDVAGIDIDLMKAIAEENDLEADFIDTDFDAIFAALKAEKCDVIASSVSITDERKKSNDFSDPYFQITQSMLVTNANAETLTDLDTLSGKVVGVQSETTGEALMQENATEYGFTVKSFTGADEMVASLKSDQIDVVVQDYPISAYESKTSGLTKVTKSFEGDENYGFVIPKSSTELKSAINDALASLKEKGKYDEIISQYLG